MGQSKDGTSAQRLLPLQETVVDVPAKRLMLRCLVGLQAFTPHGDATSSSTWE